MGDPEPISENNLELDLSHIQTEDGEPVDNIFSEKQMRLLTESLYASWRDKEGKPKIFAAFANVGLFYGLHEQPVVPDVMVALGVLAQPDPSDKKTLSYFVWEYGKPPDIVVEIVSNKEGGEDTVKLARYAQVGVAYYAIFDPDCKLSRRSLRVYERHGNGYVEFLDPSWLPRLGLGMTLWTGEYEHSYGVWLRWLDDKKKMLATGAEALANGAAELAQAKEAERRAREAAQQEREAAQREREAAQQQREAAQQEREAAQQEREAAQQAREEARLAREHAEKMAAKLRELGLDGV